jgi:hypothetical protein
LLAYHWLRAENWENALGYTLEAAERSRKLNASPEAVTNYWQALDLLDRLPPTSERSRIRADIILSLLTLPSWRRNEPGEATMLRHVDLALAGATDGPVGTVEAEALGGLIRDNALLVGAIALPRAQVPGPASFCSRYGATWAI